MSCEALAQRRHANRHDAEPIEQVLAERARGDQLIELPIRRRDDADADADRLLAADALELAVLQDAQQLGLRRLVQVADLVEEDRAAVGQLEAAAPQRRRARERALLVTEELALDQLGGDRRAVDLDERTRRERAFAVHVRGEQLLAGAGLAGKQHADVRSRDLRRLLDRLAEQRAPADHPGRLADQLAEPLVLALQLGSLDRVRSTSSTRSRASGFSRKSNAPLARRIDRVADRPVPGDHHHRRRVVALPERAEQVDAVAVRQTQIQQVEIGAARAARSA